MAHDSRDGTSFETESAKVTLTPVGVVKLDYKPDARTTLEQTQWQFARLREFFEDDGGAAKRPFQVDLRKARFVPREVRQFCACGEAARIIYCAAFVVHSKITRFLAQKFVNFAPPPFPVQIFHSEEAARVWTSRFLPKGALSQGGGERPRQLRAEAFEVTIDDSGCFVLTWNEGVRITRDHARQVVTSQLDLEGGTTAPVLVDLRCAAGMDADARGYLQSLAVMEKERPVAVVTRWRGVRLFGQMAALLKNTRSLRFFDSLDEARSWLGAWHGIGDAFARLERHNRELEEEVEARNRELRATHAQLVQSSKLAAMGELSAGIAHEINNPLAVVHARARQLAKLAGGGRLTDERAQELAEAISRNAERIAEIIKGLRNLARDSQMDAPETVAVGSILQDTLELCERSFHQTGVKFSIEGTTDLQVECRKTEMAQVFLNLLHNAFDAVRSSDEARIAVSVHDRGNTVEIHFVDSGAGVPTEIRQKILEPFYTTKPSGQGTGLGLSISQGLVRSHGGDLFLDPEAQDTTFVVSLPKRPRASSEAKPTVSA